MVATPGSASPRLRTLVQPPPARSRPGRRGGRPRPLRAHAPPAAAKGRGSHAGGSEEAARHPALLPSGRSGLRSLLRACSSRGRRASGAGSAPLRPARHGCLVSMRAPQPPPRPRARAATPQCAPRPVASASLHGGRALSPPPGGSSGAGSPPLLFTPVLERTPSCETKADGGCGGA